MKFYSNEIPLNGRGKVLKIEKRGDLFYVELDSSEFYPNKAGQISDRGFIGSNPVIDVLLEEVNGNEIKWHVLIGNIDFKVNDCVEYSVDQEKRMDASIQHTGQHLLSAILSNDYGVNTLSFRMSDEYTTIDTDKRLSKEQVRDVVKKVQDYILKAIPVEKKVIDNEELSNIKLRKEVDIKGEAQIVNIGDIDVQACSGTHVLNTKDLLLFSIKKIENYKEGFRITFLYGKRAINDYMNLIERVGDIKSFLGVSEEDILNEISSLKTRENENRKEIQNLKNQLAQMILDSDEFNKELIYFETDLDEDIIKNINQKMSAMGKNSIIVDLNSLRMYVNSMDENIDAGALFRKYKTSNLKGGGGKNNLQALSSDEKELKDFAKLIYSEMENILKK